MMNGDYKSNNMIIINYNYILRYSLLRQMSKLNILCLNFFISSRGNKLNICENFNDIMKLPCS